MSNKRKWDIHCGYLIDACKEGDLKRIKRYLSEGADINTVYDDGKHASTSPIQTEAKKDHFDIVKYLLSQGADINIGKYTPLCEITRSGHLEMIKYLISQGADINKGNHTPLCIASECGHLEVVKYLLSHGADINRGNDTPLCWASESGHLKIVKYLTSQGADINKGMVTPSLGAYCNDHLEVMKYLISQGADMNLRERCSFLKEKHTIMTIATEMGDLSTVKYLASKGADINIGYETIFSGDYITPLLGAFYTDKWDIVEFLLLQKNIDTKDFNDEVERMRGLKLYEKLKTKDAPKVQCFYASGYDIQKFFINKRFCLNFITCFCLSK